MPTVKLNRKVFESLVGKKLPIEQLKDRISMLGTDLEYIEGNEINVEVFPNRPDMLSEQGFARAFSSFIGVKTGLRKYDIKKSKNPEYKVIIEKSVSKVRPFTACAVIKNIKFDDEKIKEAIQMQEKLHVTYGRHRKKVAIGIYPMERIKWPIRFLAKKPNEIVFSPLESKIEMNAVKILRDHPTGKDYGHLLEGMSHYPIFIDADENILSMPPIVNSNLTGRVDGSTRDVFIECSGFDFDYLSKALNMLVTAFADMGGEIYSVELDYQTEQLKEKKYTPNLSPQKFKIDINYLNKRLGLNLSEKEIEKYLEAMGHGYEKGFVLVPSYRADIMHMVDFVEEVAIAYGYENFSEEIPNCSTIGKEDEFEVFKNKVAEVLVGLGMIELNTNNISNVINQTTRMNTKVPLIKLKNALSADYDTLRAWVIPSVIEILSNNKHNEYPQNLFNIGRIFKKDKSGKTDTGIIENDRLCAVICSENSDFTQIKQVLDYLFMNIGLNINEYSSSEIEHDSFISGRCARVNVKGKDVAYIGEISPVVLENWELHFPVGAFELNLTELYEVINSKTK